MEAKVQALPLFPLSVVLFPRQPLPLHIFEQRYRTMVKQCVDNNEPFGVVLAYESDVPAEIGTTVRVTDVKRLPDGRKRAQDFFNQGGQHAAECAVRAEAVAGLGGVAQRFRGEAQGRF